jgi:hypothetical protein
MIADGLFDPDRYARPIPDVVLGQHVMPFPTGQVGTQSRYYGRRRRRIEDNGVRSRRSCKLTALNCWPRASRKLHRGTAAEYCKSWSRTCRVCCYNCRRSAGGPHGEYHRRPCCHTSHSAHKRPGNAHEGSPGNKAHCCCWVLGLRQSSKSNFWEHDDVAASPQR